MWAGSLRGRRQEVYKEESTGDEEVEERWKRWKRREEVEEVEEVKGVVEE